MEIIVDKICIKGLEVFGKHGVLPEENALGQKFVISATLFCDTRRAGSSDRLEDSVNYAKVSELLKAETYFNPLNFSRSNSTLGHSVSGFSVTVVKYPRLHSL